MKDTIKIKIKTQSNLFIGGAPLPFEIGGIDQQTIVDQEGFPCIPGSTLKGALRNIVHQDNSEMAEEISNLFEKYLAAEETQNIKYIKEHLKTESINRIKESYSIAKKEMSAEYLFGIKGFNNSPKLLFNDLILCDKPGNKNNCFSIDMKNSIDNTGECPKSNPRIYKTARSGLVFEGEIQLSKIVLLGDNASELCKKYIMAALKQFNEGIHRLGNSKSRGYGKVEVLEMRGE